MKAAPIKTGSRKNKIYQTFEGKLLWCGVAMTLILLATAAWYAVGGDTRKAVNLLLAFFAHVFGGRAAGIGLCFMAEFSSVWTLWYNFYIEILIVCLTYAIFILSMSNHIKLKWVMEFSMALKKKADKHTDKIEKYGWIGLFVFVMLPLPVTGPVTGSIMGYLLNVHSARNFSAVLLGTFTAVFFWVIFFDFLEQHVHMIQYILMAIIVVVLLSHLKTLKRWMR